MIGNFELNSQTSAVDINARENTETSITLASAIAAINPDKNEQQRHLKIVCLALFILKVL